MFVFYNESKFNYKKNKTLNSKNNKFVSFFGDVNSEFI